MVERLKQIRKAMKLTQAKMADDLHIAPSTITAYETGNRVITDRTVNDICSLYNVNEKWFRTGEGEMFNPLTAVEQIATLMNDVVRTDTSEEWQVARQTVIEALAEMSPEFWSQVGELLKEIKKR